MPRGGRAQRVAISTVLANMNINRTADHPKRRCGHLPLASTVSLCGPNICLGHVFLPWDPIRCSTRSICFVRCEERCAKCSAFHMFRLPYTLGGVSWGSYVRIPNARHWNVLPGFTWVRVRMFYAHAYGIFSERPRVGCQWMCRSNIGAHNLLQEVLDVEANSQRFEFPLRNWWTCCMD